VHAALGLDSNPGTAAAPKRTIQAGIAAAAEIPDGAVHVAQGTYEVDYQNNKYITLVDGVSLYGGYKADDWEKRDVNLYASVIVDKSASAGANIEPNRAVDGGSGVGPDTVVEGFTIQGGTGTHAAAVRINASSPTFTRNKILGGKAPSLTSYGVSMQDSKAVFTYNWIEAGDAAQLTRGYGVYCTNKCEGVFDGNYIDGGGGASQTYGVYLVSSTAALYNNVINGGAGTSDLFAIYLNLSAPVIANNTILSENNLGYGIFATSSLSAARVENNIITAVGTCLYEGGPSTKLASVKNNDLSCTYYAARTGWDGKSHTEMIPMETSLKSGGAMASGNVKLVPTFVNQNGGDFRLKGGGDTFCDLSLGGLELTNLFTLDRDAAARTKPWSVGAHELDGACK
jgi:hypothetical protein